MKNRRDDLRAQVASIAQRCSEKASDDVLRIEARLVYGEVARQLRDALRDAPQT